MWVGCLNQLFSFFFPFCLLAQLLLPFELYLTPSQSSALAVGSIYYADAVEDGVYCQAWGEARYVYSLALALIGGGVPKLLDRPR